MKPERSEFESLKRFAVVGVSRTRGFGNAVLKHLRQGGYTAFPVNATADEVEGERCYRRLDDLPEPVDAAVVVVPKDAAQEVVADCARLGIRRVWLQQGSESEAAVALARDHGLTVVAGACIIMYTKPRGGHRFHRGLWRLFGKL